VIIDEPSTAIAAATTKDEGEDSRGNVFNVKIVRVDAALMRSRHDILWLHFLAEQEDSTFSKLNADWGAAATGVVVRLLIHRYSSLVALPKDG